jgi:hypothetical protein
MFRSFRMMGLQFPRTCSVAVVQFRELRYVGQVCRSTASRVTVLRTASVNTLVGPNDASCTG